MTTAILISTALLAAVAVAVVVAVVVSRQRQPASAAPGPVDPFRDEDHDALRGDPRQLKAGDIIDLMGESLVVRGSLRMREGGYQWTEHLIDNPTGGKCWLSVEEDPDLEVVLWTEVDSPAPEPGPRRIEFDGVTYQLDEAGNAQYTSEATTGLADGGTVHYYDYEGPDDQRLSYEDYRGSGSYEVATGRVLARQEITIYHRDPA